MDVSVGALLADPTHCVHIGFIVVDRAGRLTACNGAAASALGVAKGEAEGRLLRDFVQSAAVGAIDRFIERAWAGESPPPVYASIARDSPPGGVTFEFGMHADELCGIYVLRTGDEDMRFRRLIENSPLPYLLIDPKGEIHLVNPAFTQTFGYCIEDIPTREVWWSKAYPSLGYRRWAQQTWTRRYELALNAGLPFEPLEVSIRCKDGSRRTVVSMVTDLDGEFRGLYLTILMDVTEQRILERSALERAAHERHQLGMDLHDGLGQELTALSLFARALATRAGRASRGEIVAELRGIEEMAVKALGTARGIARGLSPLEPGLPGFLAALTRLAKSTRAATPIAVTLEFVGFDQAAEVAPSITESLFRIAQETVANATRQERVGSIQLRVELADGMIDMMIQDDGPGFEADAGFGAGIGFNLMRHRVRSLGGHLAIDSSPGAGTAIRLSVPISR